MDEEVTCVVSPSGEELQGREHNETIQLDLIYINSRGLSKLNECGSPVNC